MWNSNGVAPSKKQRVQGSQVSPHAEGATNNRYPSALCSICFSPSKRLRQHRPASRGPGHLAIARGKDERRAAGNETCSIQAYLGHRNIAHTVR